MNVLNTIKPVYYIDAEDKKIIDDIEKMLYKLKLDDDRKKKNLKIKSEVRSIHSSLSIEANSLSLKDISNIYENKPVLGSKKEIQEVKNAIKLYECIKEFDWKNENDLIKAHTILMQYFNDDDKGYRNHGEAIKKGDKIIFIAPDSIIVKSLMKSLFEFITDNNDIHPFVLASIFHYYFVYIHPFTDGNGRTARFWVSLILMDYNSLFEYIPIEEELYLNQEEYYNSIEKSHNNSNCNEFIKFMLRAIYDSISKLNILIEVELNKTEKEIVRLVKNNSKITQQEIAEIMNLNVRTIKRNFKKLIEKGYIIRIGSDKSGYWEIVK